MLSEKIHGNYILTKMLRRRRRLLKTNDSSPPK